MEITSNNPDRVLEDIENSMGSRGPFPFLDCTIGQVYDFFKNHLRAADDSVGHEHFSYYTFIAIDEDCLQSNAQCIICSDAPDFGESDDEIRLKSLRMPIESAMQYLCALEQLNITMSDLEKNEEEWGFSMMPLPTLVPVENERNLFKVATHAESRRSKRIGIKLIEEPDADNDGRYDYITLMRVSLKECIGVGILMWEAERSARRLGTKISLHDNRSEKTRDFKGKLIRGPIVDGWETPEHVIRRAE
jgi:hypothetical protein